MGKRIFEERGYDVQGHVLSLEEFRLFADKSFEIPEFRRPELMGKAENALRREIPQLLASDYMRYAKTGNRALFEDKCYLRRQMLLDLTFGEYLEGKGRFTEKLIDVLWAILEESTWVIPAHNRYRPGRDVANLAYAFADDVDYIDLFSAATGAAIAVAYYFHKAAFDAASLEINRRLRYELQRQLLDPFLDDTLLHTKLRWSGVEGNKVNNWCAWITGNLLTVCALTVEDLQLRTQIVARALPILDNFAAWNHDDGGCDEGPRYWELAGGSLWIACLLLRDMTGGYVDLFDEPMLKNMGEYEAKMIAAPGYLLNFADAPPSYFPNPYLMYHWGETCHSALLLEYALWLGNQSEAMETERRTPYKYLRYLTTPKLTGELRSATAKDYIESLQIAITRPSGQLGKGLYLAMKGGHNGESHNHNDVGSIVVFSDDLPVLIDPGVGEYTRRYFGTERYTVWITNSDYHNCATFNGITQKNGRDFTATNVAYDAQSGGLAMDLQRAYPPEAGLKAYRRSAVLENGCITVTDSVAFAEPGTVMFSYMTEQEPELLPDNRFRLQGRTVSFDASLVCRVEEVDCSIPEAAPIPANWGVSTLYRITLTNQEKITEKTYLLTIE